MLTDVETAVEPVFNPMAPGFFDDPYPQYEALRDYDPVHVSPLGITVVTRHEHVHAVVKDPQLSANDMLAADNPRTQMLLATGVDVTPMNTMARLDPPEHRRLRDVAQSAFTPKGVAKLRPTLEKVLEGLLDNAEDKGRIDFVMDISRPLTVQAVLTVLGVDIAEHERFRPHVAAIADAMDMFMTPEAAQNGADAVSELFEYFQQLVAEKRKQPSDDIFSEMINATDQGIGLSTDELIRMAVLIFSAGHETTMNFLSIALLHLLNHPDQLELLRSGAVSERKAIQELLRLRQLHPSDRTAHRRRIRDRWNGHPAEVHHPGDPRLGQPRSPILGANRRPARPHEAVGARTPLHGTGHPLLSRCPSRLDGS